jgi:hypothetical protein
MPVAIAMAALLVLGLGRWWVTRAPAPPPRALDAGSYVTVIAPSLRRAGCATPACHGGAASPHIAATPTTARAALAELDAVRASVTAGEPEAGPFWSRATSRAHAGAGALAAEGCDARTLARWLAGAVVRACPLPSAAP